MGSWTVLWLYWDCQGVFRRVQIVVSSMETVIWFVMKFWMLQKSFKRDSYFDWRMYSHIVLRVRGDGRSYMLNLSTMGYYDIMWNDIYSYVLFTRGGPYWQVSKVKYRKQDLRGIWLLLVTDYVIVSNNMCVLLLSTATLTLQTPN